MKGGGHSYQGTSSAPNSLLIWTRAMNRTIGAARGTSSNPFMAGQQAAAREAAQPPLVRGEDVMAALGVAPGPAVGKALRRVREAQALGQVGTRDEALAWLARPEAADQGPSSPNVERDDTLGGIDERGADD